MNRPNAIQMAKYTPETPSSNTTVTPAFQKRIIDKPLPMEKPVLPFTPEQLRDALKEQETKPSNNMIVETVPRQPVIKDISHEIDAFENTLRDVHVINRQPVEALKAKPTGVTQHDIGALRHDGFFDEFEQFLRRDDLESEGLLDQDIVWKMKEFHKRRQEGKEYYLFSKDVQQAIGRKLSGLKELEHDWFTLREKADDIERNLTSIETDIQTRSQELKELIHQAQSKSKLERPVPQGQEFILGDGQRISTLLELKIALRGMKHELFDHHVNHGRNDFAQWVKIAHNDSDLAALVQQASSKGQLELLLAKIGT